MRVLQWQPHDGVTFPPKHTATPNTSRISITSKSPSRVHLGAKSFMDPHLEEPVVIPALCLCPTGAGLDAPGPFPCALVWVSVPGDNLIPFSLGESRRSLPWEPARGGGWSVMNSHHSSTKGAYRSSRRRKYEGRCPIIPPRHPS